MIKIIKKAFPEKKLVLLVPYIIGAAIFIIAPTILLLINSIKPSGTENSGSSILEKSSTWDIIGKSITLGLGAAFVSLLIAFPYTFFIVRSKNVFFKNLALSLLLSPLLIFSIAKIFALRVTLIRIYDYNPQGIKNQWVMMLGMIYMYMPYMIITLYSVLNNMPKSLLEASNDLGFGNLKSIIKVVIPYCFKSIFSGLAIVFMLGSTSLIISNTLINDDAQNMLIGNKIDTFASRIKVGDPDATSWGSTLALVTIAVVMSVYLAIYFFPILIKKIKGGLHG